MHSRMCVYACNITQLAFHRVFVHVASGQRRTEVASCRIGLVGALILHHTTHSNAHHRNQLSASSVWTGVVCVGVGVVMCVVLAMRFACVWVEPGGQGQCSQLRILWIRLDVVPGNALCSKHIFSRRRWKN